MNVKLLIILAVIAVIALIPLLMTKLRSKPPMALEELKKKLNAGEDIVVLDVRSNTEFEGMLGHIDGAINIPLQELEARVGELAEYTERPIAVICRSDIRAVTAARFLASKGFSHARAIMGGMTGWQNA